MAGIIQQLPGIFRDAFRMLKKNNPLILASSTAFFATFSLSPIIIILVNVLSLYFKSERINEQLFKEIQELFGQQTANQIESIVENFRSFNTAGWITVAGTIFLLFVATTLLNVTKQAIHQLWHIRQKPGHKLRYTIRERLIGIAMLVSMGILFSVSLLLDAAVGIMQDYLQRIVPEADTALIQIIQHVFSILVVTAWFTVLFKFLPDAEIHIKVAFAGGLLTTLLFTIGKFILGKLLVYSNVANIFGASTSIALLLLFIFYSSFIIYFGASFTHAFGKAIDKPVKAGKRAEGYKVTLLSNKTGE